MKIPFDFSQEGWKSAQEWAKQQPSPNNVQANLWEWANIFGKESVETLHLINLVYLKDVNNSSAESFTE